MKAGCLVLETGEIFSGFFVGEHSQAGEVVFNTSHSGYEEISTDPSYYSQILVMTAPLQGNYGVSNSFWESQQIWIKGFICLEIQHSDRDMEWLKRLRSYKIPILHDVDTRSLVLKLRDEGVVWGALVPHSKDSKKEALNLIKFTKKTQHKDWTLAVSVNEVQNFKGKKKTGPKIALVDFGYKKNILHELLLRSSEVAVFPSRLNSLKEIKKWKPDGILLSNGPGNPEDVKEGTELVKHLLGWKFIFGICMGHQVLAQALGATNYKMKFGHRGSNHPIHDLLTDKIFMSSQNHGYAVKKDSLPDEVEMSHINLNDQTVAGLFSAKHKCLSVQFHPENHPGPRDSTSMFDFFIKQIKHKKKTKGQ